MAIAVVTQNDTDCEATRVDVYQAGVTFREGSAGQLAVKGDASGSDVLATYAAGHWLRVYTVESSKLEHLG